MNIQMTNEEYIEFLNTINTLPDKEREIIKRGVLQLNDDKKRLIEVISELQQRIDKANNELITLIQIINEQPSNNKEEDNYLLGRLESISNILGGNNE